MITDEEEDQFFEDLQKSIEQKALAEKKHKKKKNWFYQPVYPPYFVRRMIRGFYYAGRPFGWWKK